MREGAGQGAPDYFCGVSGYYGKWGCRLDTILALIIGIGLSAACGFRVFLPLLGVSIAALSGHLTLFSGFEWMGTWPAVIAFGTATVLEIAAYYIPWVDNLMDTVSTPAAVAAGIIATASVFGDVSPFLRWSMAIIAGGGLATVIQGGTVAARAISSGGTGGLANSTISTMELAAAAIITLLALLVPIACLLLVAFITYRMVRKVIQWRRSRQAEPR